MHALLFPPHGDVGFMLEIDLLSLVNIEQAQFMIIWESEQTVSTYGDCLGIKFVTDTKDAQAINPGDFL